jgi:hypothetical protein
VGRKEKPFSYVFHKAVLDKRHVNAISNTTDRKIIFEVDVLCKSKDIFLLYILYLCPEDDRYRSKDVAKLNM